MIEKANAKINLSLNCLGLRDDGYHELESIVLPVDLHDTLEISILSKSTPDDFVICDDFSLKISKYNLVHKMIDICRQKRGFKEHLNVEIHKNIFLQAGLGGGSADAAAAFRGIICLFKLNPSEEEIKEICNKIGSDVLVQFYNKPALVKGRGDDITFITPQKSYYCLLVKPIYGSSTAQVFKEADKHDLIHGDINKILELFLKNDLVELGKNIFNSLYKPASILQDAIIKTYEDVSSYGFEVIGMSGSGSTIFALSSNLKLLKIAEKELYFKGYMSELTKTFK